MAFYVIAGQTNCPHFVHAVQIANYLYERLPHFYVYKIEKSSDEYLIWLKELNKERGWHHLSSPIVWKEISMKGGLPYLIGGLSEFWEYIYDYYSLKTTLTKSDIDKLIQENTLLSREEERKKQRLLQNSVNVTITMNFDNSVTVFLWDLLHYTTDFKEKDLFFKLYDPDITAKTEGEILGIMMEFETMFFGTSDQYKKRIEVVQTLEVALTDCDILFIFDDVERREGESEYNFHRRAMMQMGYMADQLNLYARRTIRIVLAQRHLVCLNATILVHKCTTIRLTNIVAVTSDLGLPALKVISEKSKFLVENMCGPPVWGFVGINCYIDVRNTIVQVECCKPYLRAIKEVKDSTLPKGDIVKEFRLMSYIIHPDFDLDARLNEWKTKVSETLHRQPMHTRIRAIISLVNLWFAPEAGDEIISLGVCSNGTHGIPCSMVFSQPAKLDKDTRVWTPYPSIPMDQETKLKIIEMSQEASKVIDDLDLL